MLLLRRGFPVLAHTRAPTRQALGAPTTYFRDSNSLITVSTLSHLLTDRSSQQLVSARLSFSSLPTCVGSSVIAFLHFLDTQRT